MKKFLNRKPLRQSFTLIELVVAMAVFSLMMLMMIQFFTGTQNLWSKTDEKNNMYADARIAMDLMSSALQSVFYQGDDIYHKEKFWIRASTQSVTAGNLTFPVNLSPNSPLYPTGNSVHNDFQKAFYLSFWLDNYDLKVANDNAVTSFTSGNTSPLPAHFTNNTQTIIGNITELSFLLLKPDDANSNKFIIMNDGSNDYNDKYFPYAVQITLKMMPANAFKTWQVRKGSGSESADVKQYRQENEYEFVRIIYLGVY